MSEGSSLRWREEETRLLQRLRAHRSKARQEGGTPRQPLGERVADRVAAVVGSWRFIIIQSVLLLIWMAVNALAYARAWDPYPFILLNLVLSFQAAYTAPIIMMSQNRQAQIDRGAAQSDYDVNLKAELEIELLHRKVDMLREQEFATLIDIIREMQAEMRVRQAP